jgi:DNA invertase Pin-like site-specific DNA recombinase
MSAEPVTVPFSKIMERRGPGVKIDLGEEKPVWFPLRRITLDEAGRTVTGPADLMAEKLAEAKGTEAQQGADLQVGYARASTADESLDEQLDALRRAGCEYIFTDTISASNVHRPGLRKACSLLQEGDVLVIWRLDRLGRSARALVDLMAELAEKKAAFRSLTDDIDTRRSDDHFAHVMALLSQMECELTVERAEASFDTYKNPPGRKRSMTPDKIEAAKQLLSAGIPARKVARDLGVPPSTLYRWVPASSIKKNT